MSQLLRELGKNYQKSKEFLCSECHGRCIEEFITYTFELSANHALRKEEIKTKINCRACNGEGTRAAQIRVKLLK